MSLKGKMLVELVGKRFSILKGEQTLQILCSMPFLHWAVYDENTQALKEEGFWYLEWKETKMGDNILLLHDRATPEPLNYTFYEIDSVTLDNGISVMENSYFPSRKLIKHVTGYGFIDGEKKYLVAIVVQCEEEYFYIEACPAVMEVNISDYEPDPPPHLQVMFTTK